MWETDLVGRRRARLRRRGPGPAAARTAELRRARLDPARGASRVAQRERRGCAPPLRGTAAANDVTARVTRAPGRADRAPTTDPPAPGGGCHSVTRDRRWPTRRSTSSTATTSCTPGRSPIGASLVDALASFVATRGARGVVVFDGVGDDDDARALDGALRAGRRHAARTACRGAPRAASGYCSSPPTRPCSARPGARSRGSPRRRSSASSSRRAARRGGARRSRRQARRRDAGAARAPPARRLSPAAVAGELQVAVARGPCKWACHFGRSLLDSPRPKGETSHRPRWKRKPAQTGGYEGVSAFRNRRQEPAEGSTRT